MPLNDDASEKAARLQSRQALQEMHMNTIKAAASPARKRKSLGTGSPRADQVDLSNVGGVAAGAGTSKRVPILANFEEWMKMATDNKINATNSWNFALIDYFHDMSLLREGDSVNFQKASCTLDGCVKIYTSRVDSVATETGKLLSGLAESDNSKRKGKASEEGDDVDDEEDEEGKKKPKRRTQRSEDTLVSSFAQIQLKKMELEFAVDPLFKKASADFDEGGAKGLLLNHLTMDAHGRIVFDSSDDAPEVEASQEQAPEDDDAATVVQAATAHIDLAALGRRFFPDLAVLDEQDICPSLKTYELGGASDSLDLPFLKAADDWQKEEADASPAAFDAPGFAFDDDDAPVGGFDVAEDVAFGEGGEAWAREAAIDTQARPHKLADDDDDVENGAPGFDSQRPEVRIRLANDREFDRDNILTYFDKELHKNWAGPEHWRIRKIKDASKPAAAVKRKEKVPLTIDFAAPLSKAVRDQLYTQAASASAISLPKAQLKSKTRNLLPDDKHFNSKQLLTLFLKPKARIGFAGRAQRQASDLDDEPWARKSEDIPADTDEAQGNYDANFFQDDGLDSGPPDDDVFEDAPDHFAPALEAGSQDAAPHGVQPDGFGSQLVTQNRRVRPDYVQYARVAKKVDVRRLKEEMWRGIGFEPDVDMSHMLTPPPDKEPLEELKFTNVMNGLQAAYPKQAMADISTSYCFICLLHLANEKGLVLEHSASFEEISIRRDASADISVAA